MEKYLIRRWYGCYYGEKMRFSSENKNSKGKTGLNFEIVHRLNERRGFFGVDNEYGGWRYPFF